MTQKSKSAALPAVPGVHNGNVSYNPEFTVPCTAGYEFVTPALAQQWLGSGNRKNRDIKVPPTQRLKGVIGRHEWMYDSTDAIGLAEDDAVVNGQHRLTAIAEGTEGVWCLVVRGVRPEVIKVVDQNTMRTLTQTLQIDGGYTEPGITATAVKTMYEMVNGYERTTPGAFKPTIDQELELLVANPNVVNSLEPAGQVRSAIKLAMNKGQLTAYHYAFASVDPDKADEFFDQLSSGLGATAGNPALVLRERLLASAQLPPGHVKKLSQAAERHFLVIAWEAYRAGTQLDAKKLKFVKTGPQATVVARPADVEWLDSPLEEAA